MLSASSPAALHPFESLTPDVVMDALASVGLYGDGRQLALSSYENRVYQVHLETPAGTGAAAGDIVVVKFYVPRCYKQAVWSFDNNSHRVGDSVSHGEEAAL